MRRLIALAAALALAAPAVAPAVPAGPGAPLGAAGGTGARGPGFELDLGAAAAGSGFTGEAVQVAKKKGAGGKGAKKRGGAQVRKGDNRRYDRRGDYRSNNTVVVNRGRPYGGGGRYYYDDDDDGAGVAGALIGGVIGLGIGAAIANSQTPDNTCVDNDGDGVCDAY